jgi:hypothetical protein
MRKISSFIIGCVFAASAMSQEITVFNEASPQSPTTVFGLSFKNSIEGDVKWVQTSGCTEALSKFHRTPNSVLVWNSTNSFANQMNNQRCDSEPNAANVTLIVASLYMKICKATDNPTAFNAKGVTMGLASMIATKKNQDSWNSNGLDLKLVPYPGSAGALKAAINKEIDFAYVGSSNATKEEKEGKIVCIYSTDPAAKNYVGKTYKQAVPDFNIMTVLHTNASDPAVLSRLRQAVVSEQFVNYLNKSEQKFSTNINDSDIAQVRGMVKRLTDSWGD